MMLYARSCERPSKSSASVFFPSSVSNWYSFSTGTHGSSRRCSAALRPSSACSASSRASCSRAASHSSRVPMLCSDTVSPPVGCHQLRRRAGAKLIGVPWRPSADLLRQLDDDPRRAAHVAEPIAVLVVLQLADQLAAMRSQAGEGGLDVVDDEQDVPDVRGVGRRRPVVALV